MHHKTFYVCPSVQSLSSFRYEMGHGFRSVRTFTNRKQNDDNREIMQTKEKYIGKLFNNKNKLFLRHCMMQYG